MNTTLLIMAAGIGSRFGTGIKQLEPVDASNHIIMDYSIHDAIEAGFNHVVFIIRKDIEKEFKDVIGNRIAAICSTFNNAAMMFLRMLSFCINSLKQKSTVGSMIKSSCFSFAVWHCDVAFLVDTLFLVFLIEFSSLLCNE